MSKLLNQKVTLLYDCDVAKSNLAKDGVNRFIMPSKARHIAKGIKNLFSDDLVERARAAKPAFIDVVSEHVETKRGNEVRVPEFWTANPDEKRNLADWIIEHARADDPARGAAVSR